MTVVHVCCSTRVCMLNIDELSISGHVHLLRFFCCFWGNVSSGLVDCTHIGRQPTWRATLKIIVLERACYNATLMMPQIHTRARARTLTNSSTFMSDETGAHLRLVNMH